MTTETTTSGFSISVCRIQRKERGGSTTVKYFDLVLHHNARCATARVGPDLLADAPVIKPPDIMLCQKALLNVAL